MFNQKKEMGITITLLNVPEGQTLFDVIDSLDADQTYQFLLSPEAAAASGLPGTYNAPWHLECFKRSITYIELLARQIHESSTTTYRCVKRTTWKNWAENLGGVTLVRYMAQPLKGVA